MWLKSTLFNNFVWCSDFSNILAKIETMEKFDGNRDISKILTKVEIFRKFCLNRDFRRKKLKLGFFEQYDCIRIFFQNISEIDILRWFCLKSRFFVFFYQNRDFFFKFWIKLRFFKNIDKIQFFSNFSKIDTKWGFFEYHDGNNFFFGNCAWNQDLLQILIKIEFFKNFEQTSRLLEFFLTKSTFSEIEIYINFDKIRSF